MPEAVAELYTLDVPSCSDAAWCHARHAPSPPTKSFDFRGSDSSKLLILKGGNSHVR